ncbi:hypothetical protein GN958_ATG20141 [Phytophthora infestans]|uniref:Uncharacterized protein n=1 Tax=Phytophthora infestans TaxID=4787 RepID=A0A8S9TUK7_PHYIN|nr:hypothetical protein GN958_ATG20141 [Phytophthora infestans]
MKVSYPQPITKVVGDRAVQDWTVIGNLQPSSDERTWLEASWSGVEAFGEAMPLFGVRTTSGVEGENNGLLWVGVRSQRVFKSLQAFLVRAVAVYTKRLALAAKWKADGFELSPHAMNLTRQEQKSVGKLTVMPAATPNFLVFDAFDTSGLPNSGTSVKRKIQKVDHARGCKRKRNKDESRAKTLSSGKRHPPTALTDLGDFDEGLAIHSGVVEGKDHGGKDDNEDVEPEIAAFLDAHEREEAGVPIKPGKYLVGDCPFTICGIVNG